MRTLLPRLIALLTLALLMGCPAQGQHVDIAFDDGALAQNGFRGFLGERKGALYVLQGQNNPNDGYGQSSRFEFRLNGKLPLLLVKYDRQMKVLSKTPLKITAPAGAVLGVVELTHMNSNGEIYLLYSARDDARDALLLYSCVFDEDGAVLVDSRPIDGIPNATVSTFQTWLTPDSSLFCIYKSVRQINRVSFDRFLQNQGLGADFARVVQFAYRLVPESLNRVLHQNAVTPGPETGEFYPLGAAVNDSASVTIPLLIRPTGKDRKTGIKENYVSFLSYDANGKQAVIDFKLGADINLEYVNIELDPKQRMALTGIYRLTSGDKTHLGLALIGFDMQRQQVGQFDMIPLTGIFAAGSAEAKRHHLDIQNVWHNDDGSLVIALEHRVNASGDEALLELRDAYVLGIATDRTLKYATKVQKAQNCREYYAFTSFSSTYDGSTVYLMWNDHPDNAAAYTRAANIDNRGSLVPLVAAVDASTGQLIGRHQAFDKSAGKSKMLFSSLRPLQRRGDQAAVYASDGTSFRLGWARFKR